MQDDPPKENPAPEPERSKPVPPKATSAQPAGAEPGAPPVASELSPEEQMARFEDALKEEDWGHQPC